jgi:hypothetical protein
MHFKYLLYLSDFFLFVSVIVQISDPYISVGASIALLNVICFNMQQIRATFLGLPGYSIILSQNW